MKFRLLFFLALAACAQKPTDAPVTPGPAESAPSVNESAPIASANGLIPRGIDFSQAPDVIAFGACSHQNQPQPIWNIVAKHNPDVFIHMGDAVYAHTPENQPVAEQYKKWSQIPEYRSFREKFPIMAVWDDGDYGVNAGGADNPQKEVYKREFLKHFPYVKDAIWNQEGLYHVKYIGGNNIGGKRRKRIISRGPTLQVIMLDTRTFRSPLKPFPDPENRLRRYEPWPADDKGKTVLGEEQWKWLEAQLKRPADLRLIVSSIQVIGNEHGFEKWGNFPAERQRLFDLIKNTKARNSIILSGDRHISSIAKQDIPGFGPIFDINSSSLNRTSTIVETDPTYLGSTYNQSHFGLAQVDWKAKRVRVEIRNLEDQPVNTVEFKF